MCWCTRATSSIPYRPLAIPAWFVTTATGMPVWLNLAIASGAPGMNSTRSTEPTCPWSTMIVPSRSSRRPGRGPELDAASIRSPRPTGMASSRLPGSLPRYRGPCVHMRARPAGVIPRLPGSVLRGRGVEHEHRVGRGRAEQVDDGLLVETALVRDVDEVPDRGTGAVGVHQGSAAAGHEIRRVHRAEVDAEPGSPGGVRGRQVQLVAREEQDLAGRGQHDELLVGVVVYRTGTGLRGAGHPGRRGEPADVVLVIIEGVGGIRH